jgi:hypothetical protein
MSKSICRAPLALASDGSVIANVHHVTGATDIAVLIIEAAKRGTVFIGVVVPEEHRAIVAEAIDDAATEAASVVLAKR